MTLLRQKSNLLRTPLPEQEHATTAIVCRAGERRGVAVTGALEEALRRLKSGMTRVLASIPILHFDEQSWSGDRMNFRVRALGQVASGTVDVADDNVRLEISLD